LSYFSSFYFTLPQAISILIWNIDVYTIYVYTITRSINSWYFGALLKLRKAIIRFLMSVGSSVSPSALNNSDPTRQIYMKFNILSIFGKSVAKIQMSLKFERHNGNFVWSIYIKTISRWILLQMRNGWSRISAEKKSYVKQFLLKIVPFTRWRVKLWYSQTGRHRWQYNRCMRFACWTNKVTKAHSEYVIIIAFLRQQWLRERDPMLRYDMIYLLTVDGLSPGGSTHLHTNNT